MTLTGGLLLSWAVTSFAQAPPITSSGLNTQVSAPVNLPGGEVQHTITGGTRPGGGGNLFHSFGEFGVPTNNIANFLNDAALPTLNILSRVTGGNPSNILGTIQTEGFGNANLFLMNPAGILFGPDATLNVGGSTHFTTADYLKLADGVQFTALPSAQDAVLSIAPVTAFGFLNSNVSPISVEGSTLSVAKGQTLSLVGEAIAIGSGLNAPGGRIHLASVAGQDPVVLDADPGIRITGGSLTAPEGQINIVSVASAGEVAIGNGSVDLFADGGHIDLVQNSLVDVSGDGGGSVVIRGGQLTIDYSGIYADTLGLNDGTPMGIDIQVQDTLTIANQSVLTTDVLGKGNSGDIRLEGNQIQVSTDSLVGSRGLPGSSGNGGELLIEGTRVMVENSLLQTATLGAGSAGNIQVMAQQDLLMESASVDSRSLDIFSGNSGSVLLQTGQNATFSLTNIQTDSSSQFGQGGNVSINAGQDFAFELGNIITLTSPNFGVPSGDVIIIAQRHALLDGSDIKTQSFSNFGRGGDVSIHADTLRLNLSTINTESFSQRAGHVVIEVGEYIQENASNITTRTRANGASGDILINAQRTADIHGRENSFPSVLDTSSFQGADGNSGTISIVSPNIILDNTLMIASTIGAGDGGLLSIQGTQVTGTNGTVLLNGTTEGSTGPGGMIAIHTTEAITFTESTISNGTSGAGKAGGIVLRSPAIQLHETFVDSGNGGIGNGGNLAIETDRLMMTDGAGLSTIVSGSGQGGSINILAHEAVVLSGNDGEGVPTGIFAGTFGEGDSGDINITSPMVLLEGANIVALSSDVLLPGATGNAGNIHFEVGELTMQAGAIVGAPPTGSTNAGIGGEIVIHASSSVILEEASSITNGTNAPVGAGTVNIQSPVLTLSGHSLIETQTTSSGPSGDIILNVGQLNLLEGGALSSSTAASGPAGQVLIEASDLVLIEGRDPLKGSRSGIASASFSDGNAGNIQITTPNLVLRDAGRITVNGFEAGNAGNIVIRTATIQSQNGEITTQSATGAGGQIDMEATGSISLASTEVSGAVIGGTDPARPPADLSLSAGQDLTLSQGTTVSARSDGAVDAGNIRLNATNNLIVENSHITTEAAQASGGNIKLTANDTIQLVDSTISSSVQGNATTVGGDISLDPKFIILQNSHILAKAFQGQGGNISLIASQAVLVDPFSTVNASSALGVSGSVNIQAPTKFLSGAIVPLEQKPVNVATLYGARCAAGEGGHFSSFVDSKTDSLSPRPGAFLASPLLNLAATAPAVADRSAGQRAAVILTASIAPLVLGHAEPTTGCP